MGFRDRWITLLHRAAASTKKTRTRLTPIGVMHFCLFTALFVLAAIFVDRLLDLPRLLPESVRLKTDPDVHSRKQAAIEF